MSDRYTMHVISHTHWDREWWSSFQHFRMRLVELTDHLLDLLESKPEFKVFHFDGQTIVLDDYLQIRPENEERLRKLIREGRILIGPWYMQPDEFLVSGESHIRNLMIGRAMGEDWGNWMAVGYVPDCFGHISQLPQILRGFGIDNAVLFRGINTEQVKSEFEWRSPDGSEVLCIKMPDNNAYSNWFYRLRKTLTAPGPQSEIADPAQARQEVADLVADCVREKPTTKHLLFMDGCDHVFPNPRTPEIIREINGKTDLGTAVHGTLPEFIAAVRSEDPDLQVVKGELRCGNRDWMLQSVLPNVHSSRIHLKQANHRIETLLEKWAEPFSAIAWTLGKEYPASYLDLAWRYLLKNQPHDSICGCSIDQVHKDMLYRYDQARMIAEPVADKSLKYIAGRVDSSQLTFDSEERALGLVVFNPLSWERSEVVEAEINFPNDWPIQGLSVTDPDGNEVPFAVLEHRPGGIFAQETFDIPQWTPTQYYKIVFQAEKVPSVGYKTFAVKAMEKPNRITGSLITGPASAENEHMRLEVQPDGTLTIWGKKGIEKCVSNAMIFEDGGDFGDGYYYRKPMQDTVVTSLGGQAQISVIEDNPMRVTFRIETVLPIPESGHANGRHRSERTVDLSITSYVSLARNARRVDVVTDVDNNARDHRLRVLFPSDLHTEVSNAESIFDVVERPIRYPEQPDWREPMPTQHPQKSFVDLSDGQLGLAIVNESLPEYEIKDDKARTIAVSLFRSTGNGVVGPEVQVEGQIIGRHRFRFAIHPHPGRWNDARVWRESWGHNVPMRAVQTGVHDGDLPASWSFLSIEEPGVLLSTLKKADREGKIVVRAYSLRNTASSCEIGLDRMSKARLANLNEEPGDEAPVSDGKAKLDIGPKQVVTILADVDR